LQGNWTYYEGRFTAPSSASVLSIASASNIYLDELRLFPADAGMQCWSYKGMFGVSAETGVNGRVTYYEYDKLGRQTIVRDQDRNILSKTELHIEE
jgi:YD repeat-containing protein